MGRLLSMWEEEIKQNRGEKEIQIEVILQGSKYQNEKSYPFVGVRRPKWVFICYGLCLKGSCVGSMVPSVTVTKEGGIFKRWAYWVVIGSWLPLWRDYFSPLEWVRSHIVHKGISTLFCLSYSIPPSLFFYSLLSSHHSTKIWSLYKNLCILNVYHQICELDL